MKTYTLNTTPNYYGSMAYDIACDIIDNLNKGYYDTDSQELSEIIFEELDSKLIYYADQWKMLQEYFTPQDLNENSFNEAFELLFNDVISMIEEEESEEE